ncbi:hypothetical protein RUND412_009467 [Rhizina undulata]
MPRIANIQNSTTLIGKQGQIIALKSLGLPIQDITVQCDIPWSTCSDIIHHTKRRSTETGVTDLFADANIRPLTNCKKRSNKALIAAQKTILIDLAYSNAVHCQKPLWELGQEAGLHVSVNTILRALAENGIHRRKPTMKPFLSDQQKAKRLAWCLKHRDTDWCNVIFTDETACKTGALRGRRT